MSSASRTAEEAKADHIRLMGENVSFVGASAPIVQGTTFIFVTEPY
jgi:hypothetical protein